jgi:hypothetical protein
MSKPYPDDLRIRAVKGANALKPLLILAGAVVGGYAGGLLWHWLVIAP